MEIKDNSTPSLEILSGESHWRARKVRYFASHNWDTILTILPEFELVAFTAGQDEPANPFLQTVMRKPLSPTERLMPIGVVSQTYSLAPHREVAALCRKGITCTGIKPDGFRYEVGLSELGEWMNFRIYLDDKYSFTDAYGEKLDLRLECFNSVDGSSRLVILLGWLRYVCSNGLVIGETKIEIKERHGQNLDLASIPLRIKPALEAAKADCERLKIWQDTPTSIHEIAPWVDGSVSDKWGKKAAARVFHICNSGRDIEIEDPFAKGPATAKLIRYLGRVPGAPALATTKYDVSQALSFVATHRNNTEERVGWQADIPLLLERLPTPLDTHQH